MAQPLRVTLMGMDTSTGWRILRGIHEYFQGQEAWEFYMEPSPAERTGSEWVYKSILNWKPDGIIVMARNRRLFDAIRLLGLPAVNVSGAFEGGLPQVTHDNPAIGRMVARHFLERGLRHFGFSCVQAEMFSRRRFEGFQAAVREAGLAAHAFEPASRDYFGYQTELRQWLDALHKPAGVMASYDYQAQEVVWASRQLGLRVPDDVAVVGVDNDERICAMWTPAVSSVETGAWRVGREAARMLHRMIRRGYRPAKAVLVPPLRIVVRQSSDLVAAGDADVAAAIRYIKANVSKGIRVPDIVREVLVSRRSLERRFLRIVGCTPRAEIDRVRLERAKELLAETEWAIPRVAEAAGFAYHINFCAFFKRKTGVTPSRYRKDSRIR